MAKAKISLINGIISEQLSAYDRGLHYGDGIFETIAVINKKPVYLKQHFQRLTLGCQKLKISGFSEEILVNEINHLAATSTSVRGIIKLIITRGLAERGYLATQVEPTRIMISYPWPLYPNEYWSNGINTRICDLRLYPNPNLAGIKHLNRLENVLARNEWTDPKIMEGILLDPFDNVIEGTMTNIFIVKEEILITPGLDQFGVKGILRSVVLDFANKLNITCKIETISLSRLFDADEVFVTNSIVGIWPVKKIEDCEFSLGKTTQQLMEALKEEFKFI